MISTDPAPGREQTFKVRYDKLTHTEQNLDLGGEGWLTVRPGAAAFCFSGKKRSLFSSGKIELEFLPDEISDVFADDKIVRFTTPKGNSGAKRVPFVFFCADRSDADEIAALLPKAAPGLAGERSMLEKIQ